MQSQVFYFVVRVDDEIISLPVEISGANGQLTLAALSPKTNDYEQRILISSEVDTRILVDFSRECLFLAVYIGDCILQYNKRGVLVSFLLADLKGAKVPTSYKCVRINRVLSEHWLIAHDDMAYISLSLSFIDNIYNHVTPSSQVGLICSTENWMRAVLIGSSQSDLIAEEKDLKQISNTKFSTVLKCEQ